MKLLKLTATFGCLDGAELELRDGLNVFTLPNESGKSTWAAFLTAMFYGVDTAQRAGKGKLPDKHRYQPWNGKPMAGTMELEHEGRILVIQRTSQRGRPMGAFRAWDKATGLDVPELTAENCGQRLLGVEKAVFCRSAFLSGADLAVTQDQDLSRRLAALAASGAEHDSFPQADQTLKLWQNRCRYHKTGLIPETEEKLRQVKDLLAEVEDLRRQRLAAMAELKQASGEADALDQAARETQEQQRQALQAAAEEAHLHAETLASQTANLPGEEALQELRVRLSQAGPGDIPEDGPCPPALAGLDAEAVWPKAQADAAEYERLTAGRLLAMPLVCLLSAAAAGLAAVVLLCFRLWLAAGCCGALAAVYLVVWRLRRKTDRRVLADRNAAKALLASYGVRKKEEIFTAAMVRRDRLLAREQAQRREWELSLQLEQVRDFAPDAQTPEEALAAVDRGLDLHRQAREARSALERAELQWKHRPDPAADPRAEARRRRCAALKAELAALSRQEEAMGSWEELSARSQRLEEKLSDLLRREQALALAREALASANAQLAQVYAPRLTRLAGEYLIHLTGGRYNGVVLEQPLTLSVLETQTGMARPLAALSRGTQDQTWLALRLAMTRLLLPQDAPVVLDDALLTFDPAREQAALDLLAGERRQVLLFTCR